MTRRGGAEDAAVPWLRVVWIGWLRWMDAGGAGDQLPGAGSVIPVPTGEAHERLAAGNGDVRGSAGIALDHHQRLIGRRGRWVAESHGYDAVRGIASREADADGAARDLDPAGREGTGQGDDGRLAFLGETVRNGDRGVAPGVGVLTLANGIDKCWAAIVIASPPRCRHRLRLPWIRVRYRRSPCRRAPRW